MKNIETGIDAQINTNQYNKMVSNAAVNKSLKNGFTRDEHFEALANIEDLFKNAVLLERSNDSKNNDSNVKIHRFASPVVFAEEIADALLTVKESIERDQKRIYSLELIEIKKLSERGSDNHNSQHYTDSIDKLHQKHKKIKQFLEKNHENSRFSVAPQSEEESNKIALMEKLTGGEFRDDVEKVVSDFFDRFKIKIDVPEARYLMVQARSLANARRLSEAWDNAYNFYREDVPLFGFAFDEAGGKKYGDQSRKRVYRH